uniref:caffeoyl-CoA O-methyltransferase n=1 Tax=Solanum lycopersicum TaxID=4081 RepID=A0A3Q7GKV1_SOLLC
MEIAPKAGKVIALLLKLTNAKKTIEIGVFTGCSLHLIALTIPWQGHVEHDFVFSFIDAEQVSYQNINDRMFKLVKVGGILGYDYTLLFGKINMSEECVKETMKPNMHHIIQLNRF